MAELIFRSLASEATLAGRDGLSLSITRMGGEYLVNIVRDGSKRTESYPNRTQAWERVRRLGGAL